MNKDKFEKNRWNLVKQVELWLRNEEIIDEKESVSSVNIQILLPSIEISHGVKSTLQINGNTFTFPTDLQDRYAIKIEDLPINTHTRKALRQFVTVGRLLCYSADELLGTCIPNERYAIGARSVKVAEEIAALAGVELGTELPLEQKERNSILDASPYYVFAYPDYIGVQAFESFRTLTTVTESEFHAHTEKALNDYFREARYVTRTNESADAIGAEVKNVFKEFELDFKPAS